MKKIVMLFAFLAVSLLAGLKEDIGKIDFLQKNDVRVLDVFDSGSLYIVKGEISKGNQSQSMEFFVSKDKKVVIVGKGFASNGDELSFPLNIKKYEKKEAFKIGKGKNKYYVFTDPECPYCKRLETMIREKNLLKNNTFYFYFYPLAMHRHAEDMSKYVLSFKTDEKRWEALKDIEDKYKSKKLSKSEDEKLQKELEKQKAIGNEIGVRGTPTVIDSNGKKVNWTKIK